MDDLFDVYPELAERIGQLGQGARWGITGVSALVEWHGAYLFEVTKPKHWRVLSDGHILAGIGAIGGSLEAGEAALACLQREASEELGAALEIGSAAETHLVYEEHVADALRLPERGYPRPALFTISANLYRREQLPACEILTIATFQARLAGAPVLGDLYALLVVPEAALREVFLPPQVILAQVCQLPGVQVLAHEALPAQLVLAPVWTGRSLQLLLEAGRL